MENDDATIATAAGAVLVEKIPDLANLGAGSLIFGQALSGEPFSLPWALLGIFLWFAVFCWVFLLASGD